MNKATFIKTIKAIRDQHDYDVEQSERLSLVLNADIPIRDTSRLTNAIFSILHQSFPPKEGECEIQYFCYTLDFGRHGGRQVRDIENLYDQLIK